MGAASTVPSRGAFAGIFAFDISGCATPADFDRFRYQALSV
ncbi:hypothetical protein Q1M63_28145 [Sinorhizobium meliloti]|nr:hypothetical protein Q1M63_28145 [Sinorhizobium meliloti]